MVGLLRSGIALGFIAHIIAIRIAAAAAAAAVTLDPTRVKSGDPYVLLVGPSPGLH